jgi:ATP-dependent Lon protease
MFKNKEILNQVFNSDSFDEAATIIPITDDDEKLNVNINTKNIPILPLRNTVIFPGLVLPITVGRPKSLKLIHDAYKKDKIIGLCAQKLPDIDEPSLNDIYEIGTIGYILKILKMPDDTTSIIIQGRKRFKIKEIITDNPYLKASISVLEDNLSENEKNEFEAIVSTLKDLSIKIIKLSSNLPPEATFAVKNIESSNFLLNFLSSNLDVSLAEKQRLLEINDLKERGMLLIQYMTKELHMLELKNDIQMKVKSDIDQQQREYLLHQQMKTIQNELGVNSHEKEIEELKEKAKAKKWSKEIGEAFEKEVNKLSKLNPAAADYSVQYNYVQTILELPWNEYTEDNFDLKNAENILNTDHYGLENIKERILEHLAVLKLKGDMKSPILCFNGPPGVGKTSLGKSIAKALNRQYVRISLGGLHDEAEIRGHRRTYIGAMPGRIIMSLKKAKSSNPVFVLDEIDKVGQDVHGDPASALLEVLDPEQNNTFHDNFLDLDYDLSKIMFIATSNTIASISPPLRDRMEIINISGYIVEEKIEIAKRHLIPKQIENHGLKNKDVIFQDKIIEYIVEKYTNESGVRELEKKIAKILRYIARKIAAGEKYRKNITINDIETILGPPEYKKEFYKDNSYPGVVTGLAWTPAGGEILFIETSLSKGKGSLTLTGNLGEVMKESATIALEYIKSHSRELNIESEIFEKYNIHLHVPEGAIPKDGPSAGITMATSIASAITRRKVKKNIAMTGEITLRGKVLPVGGIKEKILAAKRAGISNIILSKENKKDIQQIKEIYIEGLKFKFVDDVIEVLNYSLLDEKVGELPL